MLIGHFSVPMNMATGSPAFGRIGALDQQRHLEPAVAPLWRALWERFALLCRRQDHRLPGGLRKGHGRAVSALSGANHLLLHFAVSAEISAHPVQAVLDDDIAGMIGRFIAGEEVNDETMAVDVIGDVGPIPGHFLNTAHTRKWWRKEQFMPKAADS